MAMTTIAVAFDLAISGTVGRMVAASLSPQAPTPSAAMAPIAATGPETRQVADVCVYSTGVVW